MSERRGGYGTLYVAQREFLCDGNLCLDTPLEWRVYGEVDAGGVDARLPGLHAPVRSETLTQARTSRTASRATHTPVWISARRPSRGA